METKKLVLFGALGFGALYLLTRRPSGAVRVSSAAPVAGGPLGSWFNAANQGINGFNQSVAGAQGVVTNVQSAIPGALGLGTSIVNLFGSSSTSSPSDASGTDYSDAYSGSYDSGSYDGASYDSGSYDSGSYDSFDSSSFA